jgi:predicted nucleic acid-binding protein
VNNIRVVWLSVLVQVSRSYGLLTSDALIVAVMQDHGLTHLASNDTDLTECLASPGMHRFETTDFWRLTFAN